MGLMAQSATMIKISLFIGQIRPLAESGRPTGIYKEAAHGRLELGLAGFVGDEQADKRVHGGPEKAVHLYPARHYARLAAQFPEVAETFVPGCLGENISTDAMDESNVRLGDIYQLGSARLQVCQPRNPCWKIDSRVACDGVAAFIAEHAITGWYWRVVQPGSVTSDDELVLVESLDGPTLADAMQLCQAHRPDPEKLDKLAATPGIAAEWQKKIQARANWLRSNTPAAQTQATAFHVKPEAS